jgi:hypothetical protein
VTLEWWYWKLFFAALGWCTGGELGDRRLHLNASGSTSKCLGDQLSVLLGGECVGCDETYPEMVYAKSTVLGEDLFDGALNGRGEFFKRNLWRGH